MKTPLSLLAAASLAASLHALEPVLPTAKPTQVAPPGADLFPPPVGLGPVPPTMRATPDAIPGEKKSKTQIAEDAVRQRIQLRLAKNKALGDPAIQAEWNTALRANTDYEKREALKRYYTLLYSRVRKIDGTLAKVADDAKSLAMRRLTQSRVDPTQPLDAADRD